MEMRKIIGILLCLVLCLTPIETKAKAATTGVDENGNTWVYDKITKTLTFSGDGNISDFELDGHSDEPKWYKWSDETEHIVIEDGIKGIGSDAFCDFVNVKSITMSDSVTRINNSAFSWCVELKTVRLSNNLKMIGNDVFAGCNSLKVLKLPNTLSKMGKLGGCPKLLNIQIPDSVKNVPKGAFEECYNLKNIVLPQNLKTIESNSFWGCKKLNKLVLPNSLKNVYMSAFQGCGLKKIILPQNVDVIRRGTVKKIRVFGTNNGANYPTKNLRVIEIRSKKLKSIQKNSFSGLSSKVTIKVPKSKKKKYIKMLRKSGLSKKVKIKTLTA